MLKEPKSKCFRFNLNEQVHVFLVASRVQPMTMASKLVKRADVHEYPNPSHKLAFIRTDKIHEASKNLPAMG